MQADLTMEDCTATSVKTKRSDFSIEHILHSAGRTRPSSHSAVVSLGQCPQTTSTERCSSSPECPASPECPPSPECSSVSPAEQQRRFEWLQCTRYRPPRLPRSRRREGAQKRKLGRNPRIPFSSAQVGVLEHRFRRSQYLSSADVAELAAFLHLSETRVKIWFQNRRARERRDREARQRGEVPGPPVSASMALLPVMNHSATGVMGVNNLGARGTSSAFMPVRGSGPLLPLALLSASDHSPPQLALSSQERR